MRVNKLRNKSVSNGLTKRAFTTAVSIPNGVSSSALKEFLDSRGLPVEIVRMRCTGQMTFFTVLLADAAGRGEAMQVHEAVAAYLADRNRAGDCDVLLTMTERK